MKTKSLSIALLCCAVVWGCANLEDAKLTSRNTFMHFYEGANSFVTAAAAVTNDGYVLAGTVAITGDSTTTSLIIIKTDRMGQKLWQTVIGGGSASSITVRNNGYIIIGDSIQYNPDSGTISELENDASRLIYLDMDGNVVKDVSYARKMPDGQQVDYHGDAITTDADGNLITLGTYREPGGYEFSYITALGATSLDTLWNRNYNYIQRDYINARAVHYNGGNILWGSSVSSTVGNFSRSYLTVPVIPENSSFVNSDYFGQYTEQTLLIKDMQAAPSGYGAIGVYAQSDGSRSNMFFIRIDNNGNFREETARYFDGINSAANTALSDPAISESEDTGEAIASTSDGGYILAGSIETTPERGNGGKDIWLIRVDAFGNPIWNTILGGPTSETVASIQETDDGGFIISGTLLDGNAQTGGLSSMFLIKTDSKGELKN